MMFRPAGLVKRGMESGLRNDEGSDRCGPMEWRWVTAGEARFSLRRSAARRYPPPCRAGGCANWPSPHTSVSRRGPPLAQTLPGEFDAIGVVDDAIEDGG